MENGGRPPDRTAQRGILERRLLRALMEEYRYGALSDGDYGFRPENITDAALAEGRAQEAREIAEDFGLEVPADAKAREKARAELRAEYEGAPAALARLRERFAGESGEGAATEAQAAAQPEPPAWLVLHEAEELVRHAPTVLRFLDDIEEDRLWREALSREVASEAAAGLRAFGRPEEAVGRFARAALEVDGGSAPADAAEGNGLSAGDLAAYLEARGSGGDGEAAPGTGTETGAGT